MVIKLNKWIIIENFWNSNLINTGYIFLLYSLEYYNKLYTYNLFL